MITTKNSLQELDIAANYTIGNNGISAIAGALCAEGCKINILTAEKCGITFTGAKALAEALASTNCPVRELVLYGNFITAKGARLIFKSAVRVVIGCSYQKKDVRKMMKILEDRRKQQVK